MCAERPDLRSESAASGSRWDWPTRPVQHGVDIARPRQRTLRDVVPDELKIPIAKVGMFARIPVTRLSMPTTE